VPGVDLPQAVARLFEGMTDWRPWVGLAPLAALSAAVVVWLASSDGLEVRNQELPELPIRTLEGAELPPEHFDGRAWVINVWLPG
jgi:hypothetical protein